MMINFDMRSIIVRIGENNANNIEYTNPNK